MISWSSDIKRFCFFDEIKYKDISNIQNIYEEEDDDDDTDKNKDNIIKNKQNIDTININNISISGPREIHAINGLLFINGKLIHDKDGKMIRENLIMKILDNKIIDLYRIFNGVYYSFEIKIFNQKPYFIIIGGNFNEFKIDNKLELFMITSIKIYDASSFIYNKTKKYPPENLLNLKKEPYPKLLIKNIKLIKRLSDETIMCEMDELSMEGYESFQNINCFAINSEFTHAAISLDKGDIILIYAYPNLIECNNNFIKMIYLPKINIREKGHVTNLFFTKINQFNNIKNILYASTSKIIYYYEWKNKSGFFSNEEKYIKLKILNHGGPGGYNGCIDIKDKYLLMGSANDDFICEFDNLEISKTWFFEGKKTNVYYFKDYILFVISGEKFSSLQIYDKKNSIFIYYKNTRKKIIGLCSENNDIYVFYEKSQDFKYIMKLSEKSLKEKIKILINKNYFDVAVSYAESYNLPQSTIAHFSKIYAENEFKYGNLNTSIQQYIKTIGYYEPSYVIQKFNKKQKINFLIMYLEKLLSYFEIKKKNKEEYNNYTILYLNCLILQDNIPMFKQYINKKTIYFQKELSKKIIDICLAINEIEFGLNYAKQKKLYIYYIELLLKLNKKEEALNFIKYLNKEEKSENNNQQKSELSHYEIGEINRNVRNYSVRPTGLIPCKQMQQVFNNYISFFVEENKGNNDINKNSLSYQFFEVFMSFIIKNYKIIEEKDMNNLIYNYLFFDKYFILIFDKLYTYQILFDEKILNRRIELYLEEINNSKDEKEKEIIKKKLLELLSNPKYNNIYDFEYLLLLLKYYDFKEIIEYILKQKNKLDHLILIIFNNKEYNKIINIFTKNSPKERRVWEIGLHLFLQELKNNKNNEEKNNLLKETFLKFLSKIVENKVITPIEILDIINEINDDISLELIKNFFLNAIEKENNILVNNLVKSKEFEATGQEVDEELYNVKEKPVKIKLTKCDECNMGIDFPVFAFRCGHYFHSLCISYYTKNLRFAFCPKCSGFKKKIMNKEMESQKIYCILNNEEGLEKELNRQNNHIDFINMLYSKGLFKFNNNNSTMKSNNGK